MNKHKQDRRNLYHFLFKESKDILHINTPLALDEENGWCL